MRQNSGPRQRSAEKHIKEIRQRTRRKFSAEEKIRIVLAGLRGEASIAELCRREPWRDARNTRSPGIRLEWGGRVRAGGAESFAQSH